MCTIISNTNKYGDDPWGGHRPTCTHLDRDSVIRVFPKGTNQIMIYGLSHCLYKDVQSQILDMTDDDHFPIRDVYNWLVGRPDSLASMTSTLEGRNMNVIRYVPTDKMPQNISRPCKAALTDLVLENCKRYQEGLPIIPLGFVIDIDDNPEPVTAEEILSSNPKHITPFELRHLNKLMHHKDPTIALIARATVVFLKMKKGSEEGSFYLERIKSPINDKTAELLSKRKKPPKIITKEAVPNWNGQMTQDLFKWSQAKFCTKEV